MDLLTVVERAQKIAFRSCQHGEFYQNPCGTFCINIQTAKETHKRTECSKKQLHAHKVCC